MYNKKHKVSLLISVRDRKKFNFDEAVDGYKLVESFFNWEKDYWIGEHGRKAKVEILKTNEKEKYIVWLLTTEIIHNENEKEEVSSVFLYTTENGKLINISYSEDNDKTEKLSALEIIDYLLSLKP